MVALLFYHLGQKNAKIRKIKKDGMPDQLILILIYYIVICSAYNF